jgi:hypothetical protein
MLIDTVYGMAAPKKSKSIQTKIAAAKEYLGEKYLLATPIKKLEVPRK